MGRELGLEQEIIDAEPTDGLWDDGRTDESQLGMTYPELERAMANDQLDRACVYQTLEIPMGREEKAQMTHYRKLRKRNMHKMEPIPVCMMPDHVL
jgi:NAD+ synthase